LIERPEISDQTIVSALREHFAIRAVRLEFLPLGWDAGSSSWKVEAQEGVFFLKIRRSLPNPAGALVPRYLYEHGFQQVLGPLSTSNGEAWARAGELNFILYPFVAGRQVWDVGMSDEHWVEFGSVMKRLHTVQPPPEILGQVQRESFIPPRLEWTKALRARIKLGGYRDPFQRELAAAWLEQEPTISTVLERVEELSIEMRQTEPELVLCHGDVHTANVLLTEDGHIFLVDWDDTTLAPRERDLLFLPGNVTPRENELFFQGYGEAVLDPLTCAYYRYFWCVEDMGGFAEMIFAEEKVGELIKADALSWFKKLFLEGSSIPTALGTPIPS
jgi:spectinomycin phosphotransferase